MIQLTEEELKHLIELTKKAENTPVIAMSLEAGMKGRDWATLAWNDVRDYWHELGRKYDFDPTKVKGIDSKTGEVLLSKRCI